MTIWNDGVGSTPNSSDLITHVATEFLTQVPGFLPRFCAIPAFECDDIDHPKQAGKDDKKNEKLAHSINLSVRQCMDV